MPEMLGYFGKSFRVKARLERVCDTIEPIGLRHIVDAVLLDDLRCDGVAHGGCQAQCRLYWKEAWLRPLAADQAPTLLVRGSELAELESRARANTRPRHSTTDDQVFRCQGTELQRSSQPVRWWDAHSLLRQTRNGNVGALRFARVMSRSVANEIGQRVGLVSRFPFMPQNPPGHVFASPDPVGLRPGELVRIRSKEEIAQTLTPESKNRGLWFDREMLVYCGKTARVQAKVERFVNEKTGRLVELASDCYILEGVICTSDQSDGRWFCPREIYSWWRECWLERLDES